MSQIIWLHCLPSRLCFLWLTFVHLFHSYYNPSLNGVKAVALAQENFQQSTNPSQQTTGLSGLRQGYLYFPSYFFFTWLVHSCVTLSRWCNLPPVAFILWLQSEPLSIWHHLNHSIVGVTAIFNDSAHHINLECMKLSHPLMPSACSWGQCSFHTREWCSQSGCSQWYLFSEPTGPWDPCRTCSVTENVEALFCRLHYLFSCLS